MELTPIERLVVGQALFDKLGKMVSTKDPDSLRVQADRNYKALFDETGAKTFELKIQGEKVGTYSIRQSKPKPSTVTKELRISDKAEAIRAAANMTEDIWYLFITQHIDDFAPWYARQTGEILDGCEWVEEVSPEIPSQYLGGTLKVDSDAVTNAVKGLGGEIQKLLEG